MVRNTSGPKFKLGELVSLYSDSSVVFPILEVVLGGGEIRYRVFQNNARTTYYESQLAPIQESAAEQKVLQADELRAHLTSQMILSPSTSNLFSLRLGRVHFVPYQYRPVLKLVKSDRPRLLIADEVGVGKTIEAGLIIKELRARNDIASVLVICPRALVAEKKWLNEMKRFDEDFDTLDGPLLRHCLHETHVSGKWPEKYSKSILPFSLFDSNLIYGNQGRITTRGLLDLDPPPKFDLVIVDEAHHIRNSSTMLHQGVRFFCDYADAVIFLSATPVQLGNRDLYTLLNVLRPDMIIDQSSFEKMGEPNGYINEAIAHSRAAQPGWQDAARTSLQEVAKTDWGRLFICTSPAYQNIDNRLSGTGIVDEERIGLIRMLEELYTFSSIINRTRRRDIGEFTTRKPETLITEFTPSQIEFHDDLLKVEAKLFERSHGIKGAQFMLTTIRRQAASCLFGLAPLLQDILSGKLNAIEMMESNDIEEEAELGPIDQIRVDIISLLERAKSLDPSDSKLEAFIKVLLDKGQMANNKALVFSTFRHTIGYLEKNMRRTGLRSGVIHGDVSDEERTSLRRRFALPKEDAEAIDVILSSEVGSEGLDFQFCDLLINYDLPWNPMRIEQRIGRLDRYGQKSEAIAIVNLVTKDTVDADIYERCLLRIGVFQHAIGGNEEILGDITKNIHTIGESFSLTAEERSRQLQQLADNDIRRVHEEQRLEASQAELLGLNVPNQTWQQEIEAAESSWLSARSLQGCVSLYLNRRFGRVAGYLVGERPLKTLRLSGEARLKLLEDFKHLPRSADPANRRWEKWLRGELERIDVTFNQATAVENPTALHLTVLHPLMRQAAIFLRMSSPGHAMLSASDEHVPPGKHHFAIYSWKKVGAKPDDLFVVVADDATLESRLLEILQDAKDVDSGTLPSQEVFDALDEQQHTKWASARARHIAENRLLVEHRIQSLRVSHQARCNAIEEQIAKASDEKILRMRNSELSRANEDFNQRLMALQTAAESADILSNPVFYGVIVIDRGSTP